MCGICGQFDLEGADPEELRRMAGAIAHRGPDDEGFHTDGPAGIASRRLSIIDVAGGHQPISNEDGTVWVVHNGEIYDHEATRAELIARGHRFRTKSDAEVIVHLYEDLQEKCVDELSGMFAFAIWDARRERLLLARDRLGQKPLFFARVGSKFLFASEIKAILEADGVGRDVDEEALHHYLSLRFVPPPLTMFRGIRKLAPGSVMWVDRSGERVERYWDLSFVEKRETSESEQVEEVEAALESAVNSHLVSDVPVGAMLSGGMDSSMVVALMAARSSDFKTFAIGVAEQGFDERPFAREVAEAFGTTHVEREVSAELIGLLPKMVRHLDEPSDPIAACMFQASKLASEHVKVVLGGDGGDELFAGFDRYSGVLKVGTYALVPDILRTKIISPLIARIPESFGYKSLTQKMRWVDRVSRGATLADRYAEASSYFRFSHEQKRDLFTDEMWGPLSGIDSSDVMREPFESGRAIDPIDRMLYTDIVTRLPEHSLMLTDRMSMAHGLEIRSPMLDHRLVELAANLPSRMKIRGGKLKHVLRLIASKHLPRSIVDRPKQGFMFPMAYWFRGELAPMLERFLLGSRAVKTGIFRPDALRTLLEDHRLGRIDNHVRIWMALNFEVWLRVYLDGEPPEAVAEALSQAAGRDKVRATA